MCIVASAEEVARSEPSGENLRQVMPRAWALGMVWRVEKVNRLILGRERGDGDRVSRDDGVRESDMDDRLASLIRLLSRLSS